MGSSHAKIIHKNVISSLLSYFVVALLNFAVRKVFLDTLGVEYLGYNGVFLSLLQLLNLADLGIASAVMSYLYKPLAEDDKSRIASLMSLYKVMYRVLGILVLAFGLVLMLLLPLIIPDSSQSVTMLRLFFLIYLAGTVSSYFLAYKSTLLVADQKTFITNYVYFFVNILSSVLRIISLLVFPSFALYLLIGVISTLGLNIVISVYVDKKYPFHKTMSQKSLVEEYKTKVFVYVKDVFISKIGGYVYSGTDNVIISIFRSSTLVGFLANYTIITDLLYTLANKALSSVQATYGNLIQYENDRRKHIRMADVYLLAIFLIGCFCSTCFFCVVQPFISVVFGPELLLPLSTIMLLSVNLLLKMLLCFPSQMFTVYRLYHYDRALVIMSAVLNIVLSIWWVIIWGMNGALLGTTVTSLFYIVTRFYILRKHAFECDRSHYMRLLSIFIAVFFLSCVTSGLLTGFVSETGILGLLEKMAIACFTGIAVPALLLARSSCFHLLIRTLSPRLAHAFHFDSSKSNMVSRFSSIVQRRLRLLLLGACVFLTTSALACGPFVTFVNQPIKSMYSSKTLPLNLQDYAIGEDKGPTCTGLYYDKEHNTFLVADIGKSSPDDLEFAAKILFYDSDFSVIKNCIPCFELFPSVLDIQGLTMADDGNIWFCSCGENLIREIDHNGENVTSIPIHKPSGIAYDRENRQLYVVTTDSFIIMSTTGDIKQEFPLNIAGQDQLFYDNAHGVLYLTAGLNYKEGPSYVYTLDSWGEYTLAYILYDSYAIEGISIVGDAMYILNDGLYHNAKDQRNCVNVYSLK